MSSIAVQAVPIISKSAFELLPNQRPVSYTHLDVYKRQPHYVDYLQSENDKKRFVLAFRDIIKKHAEIQVYEEFEMCIRDSSYSPAWW